MKYGVGMLCAVVGALIGHYFFEGAAAAYASLLISYHFFLAFLVFTSEKEKGLSMPLWITVLTHTAVLGLLVSLAYGRAHIPFFSFISWCIPALVPFEVNWLFSGKGKIVAKSEPQQAVSDASPEEQEAFREYLMQKDRAFRKPGISISDELSLWLADRRQSDAAAGAGAFQGTAAGAHAPATENWSWMKPSSVANAGMDAKSAQNGRTTDGTA